MFWGISADNWALLWSAVIGAIIAGGTAAGVALWVLGRTNTHQAQLANEESDRQDDRAKKQLDEQRKDLERQLLEQRKDLEKQLKDQKNQASMARRIDAAAALASAVQTLPTKVEEGDAAISEIGLVAQAAAIRWQIDSTSDELGKSLANFVVIFVSRTMDLPRMDPLDPGTFEKYARLVEIGGLFSDNMVVLSKSTTPDTEIHALAAINSLLAGLGHAAT